MKKASSTLSKLFHIGLWANIVEWFEFLVYVHLSSVIAQLFFKTQSKVSALIQTFLLLALSYLARPLGSLFFGYFAEKRGRKAALSLSLMMMSVPTIFIGCLPTYTSIGWVATLSLLMLRLIQGFAAGGESPITYCYMFESAPRQHRPLLMGITSNSSLIGSALGSSVAALLFLYCDEQTILNGAWRIPFLLGIPLTAWIYSIRRHIEEVPRTTEQTDYSPFKLLFQKEKSALLKGLALCNYSSVIGVYLSSMWMPNYLTHFLGYPDKIAHPLNSILLWITIPLSIGAAWAARYIGAVRIIRVGILGSMLVAYPVFILMQNASLTTVFLGLLIFKIFLAFVGGVIFEVVGSLFTQVRALGMSLVFTLPTAVVGGLTPVILTSLLHYTNWLSFPAIYCITLGLLALPAALTLKNEPVRA